MFGQSFEASRRIVIAVLFEAHNCIVTIIGRFKGKFDGDGPVGIIGVPLERIAVGVFKYRFHPIDLLGGWTQKRDATCKERRMHFTTIVGIKYAGNTMARTSDSLVATVCLRGQ